MVKTAAGARRAESDGAADMTRGYLDPAVIQHLHSLWRSHPGGERRSALAFVSRVYVSIFDFSTSQTPTKILFAVLTPEFFPRQVRNLWVLWF